MLCTLQTKAFLNGRWQRQLCYTSLTEATQAGSDGTSGKVKQAAGSVGANAKQRVIEFFMSLVAVIRNGSSPLLCWL